MKLTHLLILFSFGLCQAATINFNVTDTTLLSNDTNSITDTGAASSSFSVAYSNPASSYTTAAIATTPIQSHTNTYTVTTDLSNVTSAVDGVTVGPASATFTFTLTATTTDYSLYGLGSHLGHASTSGDNDPHFYDGDITLSVTAGSGTGSNVVWTLNGISVVNMFRDNLVGQPINYSLDAGTTQTTNGNGVGGHLIPVGGTTPNTVFLDVPTFTPVSGDDGDLGFTVGSLTFSLSAEVIPEPTSSALLGLAGLALVTRRRRA